MSPAFPFPGSSQGRSQPSPRAGDVVDLPSLQKCVEDLDDHLFQDDDTELAACPFWGTSNANGVPDLIPSGNLLQVGCLRLSTSALSAFANLSCVCFCAW